MDQGKIAQQWLAARDLIIAFFQEIHPMAMYEVHEHNAEALLARLAKNNLLLAYPDELC